MGCPGEPGLPGCGLLPHARVLHHVKDARLIVGIEVENESVRRTVGQVVAAGVELRAAGHDGLLHRILRSHIEIAARTGDVHDGRSADFDVDIALRCGVLHACCRARTSMVRLSAVRVRSGCSIAASCSTACRGSFWMVPLGR